jgi:hypothetical protein
VHVDSSIDTQRGRVSARQGFREKFANRHTVQITWSVAIWTDQYESFRKEIKDLKKKANRTISKFYFGIAFSTEQRIRACERIDLHLYHTRSFWSSFAHSAATLVDSQLESLKKWCCGWESDQSDLPQTLLYAFQILFIDRSTDHNKMIYSCYCQFSSLNLKIQLIAFPFGPAPRWLLIAAWLQARFDAIIILFLAAFFTVISPLCEANGKKAISFRLQIPFRSDQLHDHLSIRAKCRTARRLVTVYSRAQSVSSCCYCDSVTVGMVTSRFHNVHKKRSEERICAEMMLIITTNRITVDIEDI